MAAKIVKSVTINSLTGVQKYKAPGKKAEEVATTAFGDTAKGRQPHPVLDYDGATFECTDPAAYTGAGVLGTVTAVKTYTDDTTETHTFSGWWDAEPSEIDVEGNVKEGFACTLHVNGVVTIS